MNRDAGVYSGQMGVLNDGGLPELHPTANLVLILDGG